jgi:hypothetical protein
VHQVGFYYTDIQRIVYRRFGTTYQPCLQGPRILKDRTDRLSRKDGKELQHYSLRDFPEDRRSHRLRGGVLKTHKTDNTPSEIRNYHPSFVPGQTAQILLSADGCNVYIVFTLQLPTHLLCYEVYYQGFHFRQGQQIILFSHSPKPALGTTQSPIK